MMEIWEAIDQSFDTYPKQMVREFWEYWTEHNENGRKMRFEMEKVFSIKRRLATWKRNDLKWYGKKKRSSGESGAKQALDILKKRHGVS